MIKTLKEEAGSSNTEENGDNSYDDRFNVKPTTSFPCAGNHTWSNTSTAIKREVNYQKTSQTKCDMFILDSSLHICWQTIVVKVYHVLQPSPAGNLWPTLYTLPPLRHTGRTGQEQ